MGAIVVSGLEFFDRQQNIPYKNRNGAPYYLFGIEIAPHERPLPFNYRATDSVTSFKVIKVDSNNNDLEETSLSTSLITSDGSNHICDGATEYSTVLDLSVYYFLVNDRYESARFRTIAEKQGVGYDIVSCTLIVYP